MNTPKLRILLADDHSLVRIGIRTLLEYQPDMTVVGEATNGELAVEAARQLKPDVIIMDLMMPKANGAEATKRILAERPETRIIILTSYTTSADLARALANGACGAQMKEAPTDDLLKAIRAVAEGKRAVASEIAKFLKSEPPPPELTERQTEILRSVVRGLSNKDIALQFGISPVSAKKHLSVIFAKLGAATRAEAVAIALRKQLLKI